VGALVIVAGRAQQPPPPDFVAIGDVSALETVAPPTTAPTTTTTAVGTGAADPGLGGIDGVAGSAATMLPAPTTTAAPRPTVPAGRTVTALGDSVMLGAMRALQQLGPNVTVDAAVSRQVNVGIEVLTYYRDRGLLGDTVVIHLGNNGTFTAEQFDELMTVLDGHRVVFLTVKVPGRRWEDPNNNVIVEGVNRWANAVLIDWKGLSEGQPELFYDDLMHLKAEGALYYSALIAEAV
jgi:hypothetical protein